MKDKRTHYVAVAQWINFNLNNSPAYMHVVAIAY